jgi:hypothetical protein
MIGARDTRVTAVIGDLLRDHGNMVAEPETDGSNGDDNRRTEAELDSVTAPMP